MNNEQKYRRYNWDLEAILGENTSIDDLLSQLDDLCKRILIAIPDFYKTLPKFEKWLAIQLEFERLTNRISNYISNHLNEQLDKQKWNCLYQKYMYKMHDLYEKMANLDNIILKNESVIKEYLKQPHLAKYKRQFWLLFRSKVHVLSDEVEQSLAKISLSNGSESDIFTTLTENNISFADVLDSKNRKHKVTTQSDLTALLKNNDRELRKNAWLTFHKTFHTYADTLTKTLFYYYVRLNSYAKLRGYQDYVDACTFYDEVTPEFVRNLYKNVQSYSVLCKKYRKLHDFYLKEIHHISKLEPWDKSLDLYKTPVRFTINTAKNELIKAFSCFGDDYIKIVKKAFDEKWISWLPKKSKVSGAYSIGETYGLDKMYILTNFTGTIDSVSTIAHELGHSVHSWIFNQHQDIYAGSNIFYAEIPSITNELILRYYWLDKYHHNKNMQIMILDSILSDFFSATTRQIIFSHCEYDIIQAIQKNESITYDILRDMYIDKLIKYEGLDEKKSQQLKRTPYFYSLSTIVRIPHFYMNFYVYKYAIGQIVAILIADKIYQGDKDMIKKYFAFLRSGRSLSPLETIGLLGIDLSDPKTYVNVAKIIKKTINKLSELRQIK